MPRAICPICKESIHIPAGKELGEEVVCEECEEKLELVGLDPLELDPLVEDNAGDEKDDEEVDEDGFV